MTRFSSRIWRRALALIVCCVLGAALAEVTATPAQASLVPTVVSLTFDDSRASQAPAAATLKSLGMPATFYVVDGWVGNPGYLSRDDLTRLATDGHEIAGHTVTHQELSSLDGAEVARQICDDRATLQSWGFRPTNFAYPYADASPAVEAAVKSCGYLTARGLGDVRSPTSCPGCRVSESLKPSNPYYLNAPDQVDATWTLAQLKAQVTNAVARQGGWVMLTFHDVCAPVGTPSCPSETSITPTTFNAFTSWLNSYRKNFFNNTVVRTIDQQVRSYSGLKYPAYQDAVAAPNAPSAPVGVNAIANPSLESVDTATGLPACYQHGGYGSNTAAWSFATAARTGLVAQQLSLSNYTDGDAKLLPRFDLGQCAPTVVSGGNYTISTWFVSDAVTQFAVYYRDSNNRWLYWTSSPWIAASVAWQQATWTLPPLPSDAVSLSFGLALINNGTLTTDDYSLVRTN